MKDHAFAASSVAISERHTMTHSHDTQTNTGLGRRKFLTAVGLAGAAVPALPLFANAAPGSTRPWATWKNPMSGKITQQYGGDHWGTDVADGGGNAIGAAAAGTVTGTRSDSYPGDDSEGLLPYRTGNAVIVDHGDGVQTYYGHLDEVSVSEGDEVSAGDKVGTEGETGVVTGPHLHFEVHVDEQHTDPVPFLEERGVTLGG